MENVASKKLVPRAGAAYSHGWKTLWKYFISLLLVSLIVIVAVIPFAIPANLSELNDNHFSFLAIAVVFGQIFAMAYSLFVISPLGYGVKWIYLKSVRDQKAEVQEVFDSFKNYLNVVLASLLSGAIIAFGFFFVIIPGIIFACRLAFVPYLVMDKKLDPVKAVEESWRLTKGHGWRIFWMAIVAFFIIILGLICLGFGVFISFMWISAAYASFYHAVLEEKGELVEVPVEE
jgi:uncharacterized membrane protein